MTWTDPSGDLRVLLNDDPYGKQVKWKRVFPARGQGTAGTTRTFFTFEDRLVHLGNQAGATPPLRVWLDDAEVPASGITVLDAVRGEFTLMGLAPSGVELKAAYYFHEFLDTDLDVCLRHAAFQVNATVIGDVPEGLQLAALDIAAALAHRKAAERWQYRKATEFLLEDQAAQEDLAARITYHTEQAQSLMEAGYVSRRSFYDLRMDRGRAPGFATLRRQPRPWTPTR